MAIFGALGVIPDVVESQDPVTLLAKVRESFAAQLVADEDSQLIDIYLSGGGAGQVFESTILYSTVEAGNFPQLGLQQVEAFFGTERRSIRAAMLAFYAAHPAVLTTFFDAASAGDGALFAALVVYQNATTGLLALEDRDVAALTADDIDRLVPEAVRTRAADDVAAIVANAATTIPVRPPDDFEEPLDVELLDAQKSARERLENRKARRRQEKKKRKGKK